MHINSLYGLYDNSVGVIVEQNITYLVIRHRNNYKSRIVINSIITESDGIKLQSMTPVLYSTDESPTLSLTPTGEISDIKNTLSKHLQKNIENSVTTFTFDIIDTSMTHYLLMAGLPSANYYNGIIWTNGTDQISYIEINSNGLTVTSCTRTEKTISITFNQNVVGGCSLIC